MPGKSRKKPEDIDNILLEQTRVKRFSSKNFSLLYGNGLLISIIPIWVFWRFYGVDCFPLTIVLACLTTNLLVLACSNVKLKIKPKLDLKYQQKKHKKTKYGCLRGSDDFEALLWSITYNNCLFFALFFTSSFIVMRPFDPNLNYIVSNVGSSGILTLLSKAIDF